MMHLEELMRGTGCQQDRRESDHGQPILDHASCAFQYWLSNWCTQHSYYLKTINQKATSEAPTPKIYCMVIALRLLLGESLFKST